MARRDRWLEFSNCPEMWRPSRQHCCTGACQIAKWYEYFNTRSRAIETLQEFIIRRRMRYWIGPLVLCHTPHHRCGAISGLTPSILQVGHLRTYYSGNYNTSIYYGELTMCGKQHCKRGLPWTDERHPKYSKYTIKCCWYFIIPWVAWLFTMSPNKFRGSTLETLVLLYVHRACND